MSSASAHRAHRARASVWAPCDGRRAGCPRRSMRGATISMCGCRTSRRAPRSFPGCGPGRSRMRVGGRTRGATARRCSAPRRSACCVCWRRCRRGRTSRSAVIVPMRPDATGRSQGAAGRGRRDGRALLSWPSFVFLIPPSDGLLVRRSGWVPRPRRCWPNCGPRFASVITVRGRSRRTSGGCAGSCVSAGCVIPVRLGRVTSRGSFPVLRWIARSARRRRIRRCRR